MPFWKSGTGHRTPQDRTFRSWLTRFATSTAAGAAAPTRQPGPTNGSRPVPPRTGRPAGAPPQPGAAAPAGTRDAGRQTPGMPGDQARGGAPGGPKPAAVPGGPGSGGSAQGATPGPPGGAGPGVAPGAAAEARRWRAWLPVGADRSSTARPHFVVCGDDPLAHRLCDELFTKYHADVTAVLTSRLANHGPQITALIGAHNVVEATHLDEAAFRAARVRHAAAVALVRQDDVGNIHAALLAQEAQPGVRLVIRMFNMSLGYGVRALLGSCAVLSDADMAAPAFVAAALGEVAPNYVRLPGRTLYVTSREDVPPGDIVCGLARTVGPQAPVLLPGEQNRADLVLAVATGARARPATELTMAEPATAEAGGAEPTDVAAVESGARLAAGWRSRRPRRTARFWRHPVAMVAYLGRSVLSKSLLITVLALVGLLVGGSVALAVLSHKNFWHSAYVTVLTTLGGVNPDDTLSVPEQLIQIVIAAASLALVPVVTAAVVDLVIKSRLALAFGRPRLPIKDHVVVVGLGNVGTRVIRTLHDLGVPVLAVDRNENARGVPIARELGIPVVIGDASREVTLRSASVETCQALLVVSTDDVINLEAALYSRMLNPNARVVLRLFDGDFADRVQRAFGVTVSRSVSYLAAPAFAAAMMDRDVIGTIPVQRRVLLIAEVPVFAGSELAGSPISSANSRGLAQVIAVAPVDSRRLLWSPPPDRRLVPGDRLIVVARRAGLSAVLTRTAAADQPAASPDTVP